MKYYISIILPLLLIPSWALAIGPFSGHPLHVGEYNDSEPRWVPTWTDFPIFCPPGRSIFSDRGSTHS